MPSEKRYFAEHTVRCRKNEISISEYFCSPKHSSRTDKHFLDFSQLFRFSFETRPTHSVLNSDFTVTIKIRMSVLFCHCQQLSEISLLATKTPYRAVIFPFGYINRILQNICAESHSTFQHRRHSRNFCFPINFQTACSKF